MTPSADPASSRSLTARRKRPPRRRAVILIIVLVVVVVLSFAAYTFSELMLTHYEATLYTGDQLQAKMLVESGVDMVRHYLTADQQTLNDSGGTFNNPGMFQNIVVLPAVDPLQAGSVTVISPNLDSDGNLGGVRYGLEDESSRLNLNVILWIDSLQENAGRQLLMGLPGMTEEIADALLDWLDEDDEPREYGAEIDHYSQLEPAYAPKNGPLDTVSELLLVRGVTPQLLFGIDVNRNGVVDQEELNGLSGQLLNANSMMQGGADPSGQEAESMERGWSAYLTLYSQENNRNSIGEPRVDLNNEDLELLYEELTAAGLSAEWATFIVAYRQGGPYTGSEPGQTSAGGSLDFGREGGTQIMQVLDLIGALTSVRLKDAEQDTVLQSPFSDDVLSMNGYLPQLMDSVTAAAAEIIPGRININQAPRAILQGIPEMTEEILDGLLATRVAAGNGEDANRNHETWLMSEGIVTLDEMKLLMPFVCAGGNAYRAQIVGYYQHGGVSSRAEVVIDASGETPSVVLWRDLSHLGRGYPLEVLGVSLAPTTQ